MARRGRLPQFDASLVWKHAHSRGWVWGMRAKGKGERKGVASQLFTIFQVLALDFCIFWGYYLLIIVIYVFAVCVAEVFLRSSYLLGNLM